MSTTAKSKEVTIKLPRAELKGLLHVPKEAKGIVLFAHGSGSGRMSPRNQFVATKLQEAKLATLLMDLLTEEEDTIDQRTRQYRFDIDLLAERLVGTTNWLLQQPETVKLKICFFGASTGAAAALVAGSELGKTVAAIVSRGGRPDLAANVIDRVVAPTLFIVGELDYGVIELNQQAYALLAAEKKMEIVPNATHLFEEPGTLEEVSRLAANWFLSKISSSV